MAYSFVIPGLLDLLYSEARHRHRSNSAVSAPVRYDIMVALDGPLESAEVGARAAMPQQNNTFLTVVRRPLMFNCDMFLTHIRLGVEP